jgi:hypothetical protein
MSAAMPAAGEGAPLGIAPVAFKVIETTPWEIVWGSLDVHPVTSRVKTATAERVLPVPVLMGSSRFVPAS